MNYLLKVGNGSVAVGFYKPPSQKKKYFLENLSLALTTMSCEYANIMLIRDCNLPVTSKNLEVFINTFNFECSIKKSTCFKSTGPSCIDLILTNKNEFLKKSIFLKVVISDHDALFVTAVQSLKKTNYALIKI